MKEKLDQLAELLSDHAVKEFVAKALVQSLVLERGQPFTVESSWSLAPANVKAGYLAHVEHVVRVIRKPESFGASELIGVEPADDPPPIPSRRQRRLQP